VQRRAELLREGGTRHVASSDLELIIELIIRLREVVRLRLLHLLVADEVLIRGADAVVLFHRVPVFGLGMTIMSRCLSTSKAAAAS
jgi:hypothetical protein